MNISVDADVRPVRPNAQGREGKNS